MKRFSEKQGITITGQQGTALFAALIVLAILYALGLAGIYLSKTDLMISQNYKTIKQKFFTSEAALERGINILRATSIDDWDSLIEGATESNPEVILSDKSHPMSDVPFPVEDSEIKFTIRVKNNLNDPVFMDDTNYTVDEQYSTDLDDILVIISESRSNGGGEAKCIETAVQWEPEPLHGYGGKDITTDNINVVTADIDWS